MGGGTDSRYLFLVPWRDRTIVGTAYAPAESEPAPREAAEFLAEAARAFPWAGLETAGVRLVHQGWVPGGERLAPVVPAAPGRPRARDRLPGLIAVVGVKYTTARALAERAVDLALRRLRRAEVPSQTAVHSAARPRGGHPRGPRPARRPQEMALHLADAVLRRLDLGTAGRPCPEDVERVSAVMAGELGWDAARLQAEDSRLAAAYQGARIGPPTHDPPDSAASQVPAGQGTVEGRTFQALLSLVDDLTVERDEAASCARPSTTS